jgi:hypothetical protein
MMRRSLTRVAAALAPLYRSVGWFTHRGVKVAHPGTVVEQASVCAAIDATVGAIMNAHPESGEALAGALRGTWLRIHPGAAFEVDGAVLQTRMERLRGGWLTRNAVLVRIAAEPHLTIAARVATQLARAWALALKLPEVRK